LHSRSPAPSERRKTLLQNTPLFLRQFRALRKLLNDTLNGREVNIISSGLVVATDKILSHPKVIDHSIEVPLQYVTAHTPPERGDVVVKSVMNRSQDTLNLGGLHRYNTILSLLFCHAPADQAPVGTELPIRTSERSSFSRRNLITALQARDILTEPRFATKNRSPPLQPPPPTGDERSYLLPKKRYELPTPVLVRNGNVLGDAGTPFRLSSPGCFLVTRGARIVEQSLARFYRHAKPTIRSPLAGYAFQHILTSNLPIVLDGSAIHTSDGVSILGNSKFQDEDTDCPIEGG
jgi:hypothetical protein